MHSIGDRTLEIAHLLIKGSQMSKSASNYGNRISSQNVLSKSLSLVVGGMLILGNKLSHAEAGSAYTMLSEKNCTVFHSSNEPEVGADLHCNGPAGYRLIVHDEDSRVSVAIVSPDGKTHELRYWNKITKHFSEVDPKAEWRVQKLAGRYQPIALIVRVKAHESEQQPQTVTSYLAVAKLTKDTVCVIDRIKDSGAGNLLARRAADQSAKRACLPNLT
ncbi:hypothetical protein [Burkholderia ubonensis]|uniref:hypothetical protein n=1 Tax=Burkholderia ubonensis TaxID=101571 RepID=UPI0012FA0E93|nr:hypothetical protein [Burkholderia ubonensis]